MDLIQLHNRLSPQRDLAGGTFSVEDVLGEVVEATEMLRAQGKVRFWGLTGVGVTESLHRVVDSGAFYSVQTVYNLLNASAGADEARISGVLPTQLPDAIGDEPASDYLDFKEQPGLPFNRAIRLAN